MLYYFTCEPTHIYPSTPTYISLNPTQIHSPQPLHINLFHPNPHSDPPAHPSQDDPSSSSSWLHDRAAKSMRPLQKRPLSCAQSTCDMGRALGSGKGRRSLSFGPVNSDFLMVLETEAASGTLLEDRLELLAKEFPMPMPMPMPQRQRQEVCYASRLGEGREVREQTGRLVALVLVSGIASAYSYILLNTEAPGSADLILFAQYVFCVLEGLYSGSVSKYYKKHHIPFRFHLLFVFLFGVGNFLYTASLQLKLPLPAHIVIKNSGISITMALGYMVLHKTYCFGQLLGVVVISAGILMATLSSSRIGGGQGGYDASQILYPAFLSLIGVTFQSLLNISHEVIFDSYGKHFQEAMFFQHLLGLPLFALNWSTIVLSANVWEIRQWAFLLINIVTAYLMKLYCLKLTAESGSMVCVLTVTFHRFLSLLVSSALVSNKGLPLPLLTGGILVLGGTWVYLLYSQPAEKRKEE